ncbi:MAG: hypothetical protein CR982_09305 [Candidatus Cloacimonadota bacterium]|nr:MAG: hypothetical protein CR982_09305 [Candidatus Cloacimonadota bacterium]PIE77506.1 MAG: hypothetical protein CSA15_12595 [Candidatus Delongbacteria bacterium]
MSRYILVLLIFTITLLGKNFVEIQNLTKKHYLEYGLRINTKNLINDATFIESSSIKGEFNERFKNLEKKDRYYLFTLDKRGSKIWCKVNVYKKNGLLIYSSPKIQGSEKKLNIFIRDIFSSINSSLNIIRHISIIPNITDNYTFRKYLFAKYLVSNNKKDQAIETLEDILISGDENSEVRDLFISLGGDLSNIDLFNGSNENSLFEQFILKGYKTKIKDIKIVPQEDDSTLVDITVMYEINFRSGIKKKLISTIKENKGDLKFSGFDIYTFSGDENSDEKFFNSIKNQALKLKLNSKDSTLYTETKKIDSYKFESGVYRNTTPLFPIMPQGPVNRKFKIVNRTNGLIIIKNIPKSSTKKIDNYLLETIVNKD